MDKNKNPYTIEEIEEAINKVYLLVDPGIIRAVIASVVANKTNVSDSPVWLLIMAGSSAGKTIMLKLLDKCGPYIIGVDTLTTNTFASSMRLDEEVSLLHKANNGILIFKDFTVLTTMNDEGLREIMGQLRSIFDGSFDKKSGNANDVEWRGKLGIIAAGTIEVQRKMRQFSKNGERFLNYIIDVADSKELIRRAIRNHKNLKEMEDNLATMVSEFINYIINNKESSKLEIPDEVDEELINVADFCTLARSPVIMTRKDETVVEFVPDREIGARMVMMLKNIATALMLVANERTLSTLNAKILYKIAFDSIPVERRLALRLLSQYTEATTKNIAIRFNLTTSTVRGWLNQLNALKMIDRKSKGDNGGGSDLWSVKKEYKSVILKYEGLEDLDMVMEVTDEEAKNAYYDEQELQENEEEIETLGLGYMFQKEGF